MARKPKRSRGVRVEFGALQQMWTDLSCADWLAVVTEIAPASCFAPVGDRIVGRCPFHDDPDSSFVVAPASGVAQCFGCHRRFFCPLTFVATLRDPRAPSLGDTLLALRRRFRLSVRISEDLDTRLRAYEAAQALKNRLCGFFCEELREAIATYPESTPLWAREAVEYVTSMFFGEDPVGVPPACEDEQRPNRDEADPHGIWPAMCANQLVGVLPPEARVIGRFGAGSEEHRFFRHYFGLLANEKFGYAGHVVYPLHNGPGSVCRFKLRPPTTQTSGSFFVDDAFESELGGFRGIYGLHYYRGSLGLESMDGAGMDADVMVVEDENDVLALVAHQERRQSSEVLAMSLAGGPAVGIDRLSTLGAATVRLVGDHERRGEGLVAQALASAPPEKVETLVFRWPDEYLNCLVPGVAEPGVTVVDEAVMWLGYEAWVDHARRDDCWWPLRWMVPRRRRRRRRMGREAQLPLFDEGSLAGGTWP